MGEPGQQAQEADVLERYDVDRPPENDEELRRALYWHFGVVLPDYPFCQLHGPHYEHVTPFRAFADAFFSRGPTVHVWKGSREFGGKTYMLGMLGIAEAAFLGAEDAVLAASGEQSGRVIRTQNEIWTRDRAEMLRLRLVRGPLGAKRTTLANGGSINAQMASEKSVRGPHPHRLRVDEADEMKMTLIDSALGQPATKPSRFLGGAQLRRNTVLASTQQYADRAMHELIKRCTDGPPEKRYAFYEWCWRETMASPVNEWGWLDPVSVGEKRNSVPESMWDAEYEGQEPNPADRAILPEKVALMFKKELGALTPYEGELEIEPYRHGARYGIGVDWARKVDRTVFVVLRCDVVPARVVYYRAMLRKPWDQQLALFADVRKRFRNPASCHDAGGVGDFQSSRREPGVEDVHLSGLVRVNVFGSYIKAVEHQEIVAPWIALMEKEHRLCSNDDLTGNGHPPDTFVAGALAYKAASKPMLASVHI